MASNLILVAGPVVGLAVLRAFGPVRPLPGLLTAVGCQLLTFFGYAYAWRPHVAHRFAGSGGKRPVMSATMQPTLGSRLSALSILVVIASVIAVLFLTAQFLVSRGTGEPPPAG